MSGSSFFTGAKSARSGMTSENGETLGSEMNNGTNTDDDNATRRTRGVANDPIYIGINSVLKGSNPRSTTWALKESNTSRERTEVPKI